MDDQEVHKNDKEKECAMVSTDHRIMSDRLKAKEEERAKIKKENDDMRDQMKYIVQFNDEVSKKIEDMIDEMKRLKKEQGLNRDKASKIQNTTFMQKESEENLVRHSLKEVQDQGIFYKRDNEKYTKQRDKLQQEKANLLAVTARIQNEIDYMMKMDKNLTRQLKLRNDDCESQLVSLNESKIRSQYPLMFNGGDLSGTQLSKNNNLRHVDIS